MKTYTITITDSAGFIEFRAVAKCPSRKYAEKMARDICFGYSGQINEGHYAAVEEGMHWVDCDALAKSQREAI